MRHLLALLVCGLLLPGIGANLLSTSEYSVPASKGNQVVGEFFEVGPGKVYRLTGKISGTAKVSMGLMFYDKNKSRILPHEVNAVPGTETDIIIFTQWANGWSCRTVQSSLC